jgi:hypothetical protein
MTFNFCRPGDYHFSGAVLQFNMQKKQMLQCDEKTAEAKSGLLKLASRKCR